jgi:hypothetical protein
LGKGLTVGAASPVIPGLDPRICDNASGRRGLGGRALCKKSEDSFSVPAAIFPPSSIISLNLFNNPVGYQTSLAKSSANIDKNNIGNVKL